MPGSSNEIIEDPGKKNRVKGMSYYVKGDIKVWNGSLWLCDHGRRRSQCKECGGASICDHGRRRSQCKECGGTSICDHGRERSKCKECGGTSICDHGRERSQCKECGGASICDHGRQRSKCKECGGTSICDHGRERSKCKECGGASICDHGRRRSQCKECGGASICDHGRRRSQCKECGGTALCSSCRMIIGSKRLINDEECVNMCADCFYRNYPDLKKVPSRYKRKQHYIHECLIGNYGDNYFEYDRRISGGCSAKQPDWFLDLFSHCIDIECDENQHKPQQSCDVTRLSQLWEDCAYRPFVTIRFNPDKYTDSSGIKHKGCFDFDEKNTLQVDEEEFQRRIEVLFEVIDHYLQTVPEEMTPVEYLFFDGFEN